MIQPQPVLHDSAELLVLRRLRGWRITSVKYRYLPSIDSSQYLGSAGSVDADISAVVLALDDGRNIAITWAMEGEAESLGLVVPGDRFSGLADREMDVTDTDGWSRLVGRAVVGVSGAWHIACASCAESLWSLRLDFDDEQSVVVALGTTAQELQCLPDELVVIHDAGAARSYRVAETGASAWGTALAD